MTGLVAALGLCLLACQRSKAGSSACVTQLVGNWLTTCALLGSGEALCWGDQRRAHDEEPAALRHYPRPISRLFLDRAALCAGAADGSLWCEEYDPPSYKPRHLPEPATGAPRTQPQEEPFDAVSHLTVEGRCALTKNEVSCWEGNGQPMPITELPSKPIALVGGEAYACVLLENGQVFCRGYNNRGQLGILEGATEDERNASRRQQYARFTQVKALGDDTRRLASWLNHSCALKRDGSVWCWGRNDEGQIGKGDISSCEPTGGLLMRCTPEDGLEPIRVAGLPADIRDLVLGLEASCAIDGQGNAWCWGRLRQPTPTPVRLDVGAPVTSLTIGERWCA